MRLYIPFVTTRIEEDLLLTFVLTPLWWILGMNVFIYQVVGVICMAKLTVRLIESNHTLQIPKSALWFGLFLLLYLISILINAPEQPLQRVFASANNYLTLFMGLLILILIYHSEASFFLEGLGESCWFLCLVTGGLAIGFILLWLAGEKSLEFPSLLAKIYPNLLELPFFYSLLMIRVTSSDMIMMDLPRVSIYSAVHTATGGFMLMILPLAIAHAKIKKISWIWRSLMVALALTALFFSLSRTAICAFVGAYAFISILVKRQKIFSAILILILAVVFSGYLYDFALWMMQARNSSTVGRIDLYTDAIRMAWEQNPLLGIGIKPREEFTLMAVGSHSTYVGLFLVTGALGLLFFLIFQGSISWIWWRQKDHLSNENEIVLWKMLGVSYASVWIWLATDSLDALPYIAFTYFLLAAAILILAKNRKHLLS